MEVVECLKDQEDVGLEERRGELLAGESALEIAERLPHGLVDETLVSPAGSLQWKGLDWCANEGQAFMCRVCAADSLRFHHLARRVRVQCWDLNGNIARYWWLLPPRAAPEALVRLPAGGGGGQLGRNLTS